MYIYPAWREQVHLDDHVAVFFEAACLRDEAPAFFRLAVRVEAIGGTEKAGFLGGVVGEGLSVGYVAGCRRRVLVSLGWGDVAVEMRTGWCDPATSCWSRRGGERVSIIGRPLVCCYLSWSAQDRPECDVLLGRVWMTGVCRVE